MDPGDWDYLHWLDIMGGPEAVLHAGTAGSRSSHDSESELRHEQQANNQQQRQQQQQTHEMQPEEEEEQRRQQRLPSWSLASAVDAHQQTPRRPSFSQRPLLEKMLEKMER